MKYRWLFLILLKPGELSFGTVCPVQECRERSSLRGSRAAALPSDMMLCVISYWVLSGAKWRQIQQLRCCVLPAKMLKRRDIYLNLTQRYRIFLGVKEWRCYEKAERYFLLSPKIRNSRFLFDSKFRCYTFCGFQMTKTSSHCDLVPACDFLEFFVKSRPDRPT